MQAYFSTTQHGTTFSSVCFQAGDEEAGGSGADASAAASSILFRWPIPGVPVTYARSWVLNKSWSEKVADRQSISRSRQPSL